MRNQPQIVLCTVPDRDTAEEIANILIADKLAACVNILPGVTSVYRWEGRIERDGESLLVIKSRSGLVDRLVAALVEAHPYEVPEVIALPVTGGNPSYLRWAAAETAGEG